MFDIGVNGDIVVYLVIIPKDELQELWQHSGMPERWANGEFTEKRKRGSRTGDPVLVASLTSSEIIVLRDSDDEHVATISETRDAAGTLIESHCIDYVDPYGTKWHRPDRSSPT